MKKIIVISFIVFVLAIISVSGGEIEAFASYVATTPRYTVNGSWTVKNGTTVVSQGTGPILYQGNVVLNISMYSSYMSGQGSIAAGTLTNFRKYNIEANPVCPSGEKIVHEKFEMFKDGSLYKSNTYSSQGTVLFLSESLADGKYSFTYSSTLYKNSTYIGKIAFNFNFDVDNTDPVGSLTKASGGAIANGTYSSSAAKFTASDTNFSKIFYRKNSGTWNSTTATTYSVSTVADNGFWEFYAVDKVGNQSSTASFYYDSVKPVGAIKDANNNVLENNGCSNKAFKVIFTDANLDSTKIYVKKPGASTFTQYTNDSLVNDISGKYVFKAIDKASNTSNELTFTLDKINPTVKMYLDDVEVVSGKSLKGNSIKAVAFDEGGSGVLETYVKTPGAGSFIKYTANTTYTSEGRYEFYAKDKATNVSNTVWVLVDRTSPILSLYTSIDVTGENYVASNRIKCLVTDSLSGVYKAYVKTEADSSFVEYTPNTYIYAAGNIKFYALDKANNKSIEHNINLDNISPIGNIYVDGQIYQNQYVTKSFKYIASDENSGIKKLEIFYDNLWRAYEGETISNTMPEGIYKFRATDNASNVSIEKSVILSLTPPSVEINIEEGVVESGIWLNRPFSFRAIPYDSEIVKSEIRYPNSDIWQTYIENSVINFPMENGTYSFRVLDDKGLYSDIYTVNVDTLKPQIKAYLDDALIESEYLKGSAISFEYEDENDSDIYIKVPNALEFNLYQQDTYIYSEGRYFAYTKDVAGNESDVMEFVLDNSKKTITLIDTKALDIEGESFVLDSEILELLKNPTLSYELEENDINLAPIEKVTINDIEVSNNQEIITLLDGEYTVVVLDRAGNVGSYTFKSKVMPVTYSTLYTSWYEVAYINATQDLLNQIIENQSMGDATPNYINFTNKNQAFAYSYSKEEELVQEIDWNIDYIFPLDEIDRVNRKEGLAYIYRHSDDETNFVVYFTQDRLLKVIRDYATKGVAEKTFLDGNPKGQMASTFEYVEGIVSNELTLDPNLSYMVNGKALSSKFNLNGIHQLVAYDSFGNNITLDVNIVSTMPKIEILKDNNNTLLEDDITHLTSKFSLKVLEENAPISILEIYKGDGKLIKRICGNSSYDINESGIYKIKAYNHSGKVNTKTIYLSLSKQSASFQKEEVLRLNVLASKDAFAPIETISVFVKYPSANEYIELFNDDLQNQFNPSQKAYTFLKSGKYKVIVEDQYRRGSNAIEATFTYELPVVPIQIEGIENGESTTNKKLVYIPRKNVETKVLKDGELLSQNSSYSFRKEGTYKIIETNADGIEQEFIFSVESSSANAVQNILQENQDKPQSIEVIEESSKLSPGLIGAIVIFSVIVLIITISFIVRRVRRRRY